MPKTYKGRTPQEQREFNRARKERFQQAKANKQSLVGDEELDISIQAEDVPISPLPSLKDRILSRFIQEEDESDEKPSARDKQQADKSEKLIAKTIPLTLAALIALYSKRLFNDPFKPCAPSKNEVADILLPIFSIIARSVEVEAKINQTALDIAASLLASITLGFRMLMTREDIINDYNRLANSGQQPGSVNRGSNQGTDNSWANYGAIRHSADSNTASHEYARGLGASGGVPGNTDSNGAGGIDDDRTREARLVDELFRKDYYNRVQMGLAPRPVPTSDRTNDTSTP